MAARAIFLDRDGVLNRTVIRDGRPFPPASLADLQLLPGVERACWSLRDAGYLLIVVTNQPDIRRGTTTTANVNLMNDALVAKLPIDAIRTCPHDDIDGCECRKPKPGMLIDAARDLDIDLASSFMIGDRWRDVEAGRRAGCRTIWIDCGYDERAPVGADLRTSSLQQAAPWILNFPTNGGQLDERDREQSQRQDFR
jgi:D-glycero-D-manno-heptose 1,7-bisphosphate phosphatase